MCGVPSTAVWSYVTEVYSMSCDNKRNQSMCAASAVVTRHSAQEASMKVTTTGATLRLPCGGAVQPRSFLQLPHLCVSRMQHDTTFRQVAGHSHQVCGVAAASIGDFHDLTPRLTTTAKRTIRTSQSRPRRSPWCVAPCCSHIRVIDDIGVFAVPVLCRHMPAALSPPW